MVESLRYLTREQREYFDQEGYLILKGLFLPEEVAEIEQTFEEMSHRTIPNYFEPELDAEVVNPLKRYPRVMFPHRFNDTAMKYMLKPEVLSVLKDLYEEPALAAQSMFYFKPKYALP